MHSLDSVPATSKISDFRSLLASLSNQADNNVEKGQVFERVVKAFLEQDKAQSERFEKVWLWSEWPRNQNRHDTGIDIVAQERETENLVAIQCKFFQPDAYISLAEVNKFLAAYSVDTFSSGIFVSTSENWGKNAEYALEGHESKPVLRWGPQIFEDSSIDWKQFSFADPRVLAQKESKALRQYQKEALDDVIQGFEHHCRGKLIMACGSGKTFTALHIVQQMAGVGGSVLFLTPSLSLLSQAMNDWTNDADLALTTIPVCSDVKITGSEVTDSPEISLHDLQWPASTKPDTLQWRFDLSVNRQTMKVVFSTYQSLNVVAEAQKQGLPQFDLIICDEAHRTTGVTGLTEDDESNFQLIHNDDFIAGRKRLYMTATPRIYGDRAQRKANERRVTLVSMDDEKIYGPEFHRLGFGKAVEMGILSDYKVVILDIDQEEVGIDLDKLLSDTSTEVNLNNGARMVGCWNGLRKRGMDGEVFGDDPLPAKRAVAFSNTIKQSREFNDYFSAIVDQCIDADSEENGQSPLRCAVEHVDGTQNALTRSKYLDWLREEAEDNTCRVLTNARCLTEGIDVPALDAILFMHPRKSEIDVVQAVGRVMRKSPGKKLGYIILPIARAPGANPQETLNSSAYKAVWQVINAIASHDDRFEAKINQLKLESASREKIPYPDRGDIGKGGKDYEDRDNEANDNDNGDLVQQVLPLEIVGSAEFKDAILATTVDRFSNPRYWEDWADKVGEIARNHESRIRALLRIPSFGVQQTFTRFLQELRHNLHDDISEDDAIAMLSQHLVSKPVFDALFADFDFEERNPVSRAMQTMLYALEDRGLEKETVGLESFYRDVRIRAENVGTAEGKQRIIKELYERFFKGALPDETFKSLGIAYTPVEVVDYIVRSVEDLLNSEFDASLSDEGVHIIDPFVGTGTFITRLLQSGLIKAEDLPRKYDSEIHANEINLLAYYIAAVNIEAVYHEQAKAGEYQPFEGIVLTDTFQAYESSAPADEHWFPENNQRIARQKQLDIRVVIGNPPWSASNNRAYPSIDSQVQEVYARPSTTLNQNKLYDPYVKAIRLASDWIQDGDNGGIVAYVTNGGFIDSNSFDGFRKAVAEEFDVIYCYNLRGDQRTSGEISRREGGKIFGQKSRAGVAILFLVKRYPPSPPDASIPINYRDIGDYLKREAKLACLQNSRLSQTKWETIRPNEHNDWINQRSDAFSTLRPLTNNDIVSPAATFLQETRGLVTSRDAWCFNSSANKLRANIRRTVAFYNREVAAFQNSNLAGRTVEKVRSARSFVTKDTTQFHWSTTNYSDAAKGITYTFDDENIRVALYRPFCKQRLYFDRALMDRIRKHPELYPDSLTKNLGIAVTGLGSNSPFHVLMTDAIPEYCLTGVNTFYYPHRRYEKSTIKSLADFHDDGLQRISNLNPAAVAEFRTHYSDAAISEDDLFYYTYGVLHSQQWRDTFANDLAKSAARIPMADSLEDFRAFADAGRELAELHVNYETVEAYPLEEIHASNWNPNADDAFRVQKMKYAGKRPKLDTSTIIYNAGIILKGIPAEAHEYKLGTRSALDWLIDRYQVRTHNRSGIVNDPNDWAEELGEPRYILDLIKRVTTVSVRTVEIVNRLPELPI
ncbi:MAG: DEAD/DEAH box helicase family protein [Chloroflexota bacterium]|nr:DEAD/DEAH box helicase family protein [Chloroflexota bacterium]